ncbi:MAG TPA: DUF1858 domain-containing protein [Eubacteriales bacterium]|jgi:hybrid cluster-associated redox disulfide protein|nr:DUF1858 domain-containing protein [Clostridia bacterium]HRR90013.1 DUF1858 domain-containing protein [Eubacteriales bacterium]HRU83832.1 DUF1858 domain-containing protein [Eubacteriales bacterium]
MKVTKDMLIADIIGNVTDVNAVVKILQKAGMHCIGCAMAHGETLEQACEVHGADADKLAEQINQYC